MSRHTDALARARTNIALVLKTIQVGTAVRARTVTKYELGLEHAEAWAADQPPRGEAINMNSPYDPAQDDEDPPRRVGGSSSPGETSDRREEAGVKHRAADAASRLTRNALAVEKMMDEIYRDTMYLTEITPERPDEPIEGLPGCRSCARIGAFSVVWDRFPAAKAAGLCRFCWEYRPAPGQRPAIGLLEAKHNGTKRDVSAWLAKHMPDRSRAVSDEVPSCATTFFTTSAISREGTHEFHCHRGQGHDGEHASVDQQGNRVTPATVTA